MKRVRKIVANGSSAKVEITVKITSVRGHLVTDEVETMTDAISDGIMSALPGVRYLYVPLSRIKVS